MLVEVCGAHKLIIYVLIINIIEWHRQQKFYAKKKNSIASCPQKNIF